MRRKVRAYPKVTTIEKEIFDRILAQPLTERERELIFSFMRAQDIYKKLTRPKHAYFWTIYNKYLPAVLLEYDNVVKVRY